MTSRSLKMMLTNLIKESWLYSQAEVMLSKCDNISYAYRYAKVHKDHIIELPNEMTFE